MTVNINTNVFTIVEDARESYIELTMEFDELSEILHTVLNKWNDVQCRHTALLAADGKSSKKLRAMAETLITVCDKAMENEDKSYKRVLA